MPESLATPAEVRELDSGYSKETQALLFQAYRDDSAFAYLFNSRRAGFDQRVRATIKALVKQHFLQDLPAIGLFMDDRLVAVALVAPPQRRLGITESWAWRLQMVLTAGFNCTRRYLEYHNAVMACLPTESVHVLPLMAVHKVFQSEALEEQLFAEIHAWCGQDAASHGVVLDTSSRRDPTFFERQGYQEIGEIDVGPVRERVFFYPNPQVSLGLAL